MPPKLIQIRQGPQGLVMCPSPAQSEGTASATTYTTTYGLWYRHAVPRTLYGCLACASDGVAPASKASVVMEDGESLVDIDESDVHPSAVMPRVTPTLALCWIAAFYGLAKSGHLPPFCTRRKLLNVQPQAAVAAGSPIGRIS